MSIFTIILSIITQIISPLWVYHDATSHKIGRTPGEKGFFNNYAGTWAITVFLIWIVALPVYIAKRGDLIEKAKENPKEVNGKGGKMLLFLIAGIVWVALVWGVTAASSIPRCNSSDAKKTIKKIVERKSYSGIKFIEIKEISETGYSDEDEIRSCKGTLVLTSGEDELYYSIEWQDKEEGKYYVQTY